MPIFDFTDPNMGALAGFLQGVGQAAIPTRVKTPIGATIGMAAGGAMQGAQAAQALQNQQAQTALEAAQAIGPVQQANVMAQAFGQPGFDMTRLRNMLSGNGSGAGGQAQAQAQPPVGAANASSPSPMSGALTNSIIGKLYGGDTDLDKLLRSRAVVAAQGGDTSPYDTQIAKINSVPVRQGEGLMDPATGTMTGRNPNLPVGAYMDNGRVVLPPGATEAIQATSGAHSLGETQNTLHEVVRNGVPQWVPGSQLMPGEVPMRNATVNTPPTQGASPTAQPNPLVGAGAPANMPLAQPQPQATLSPATNLPSWMPQGREPQTLADAFGPDYQKMLLTGPKIPNQAKPTEAQTETQKDAADKLNEYQEQAAGEGPTYNNVRQLGQIIQNGFQTGAGANAANLLASYAKRIPGMGDAVPDKFDPASKEAFTKLSTDLVFKVINQIGGQIRNKELEGVQKANPDVTMRPEAIMDILSNIGGTQGWMGMRSKMAGQWFDQAQNLNGFDNAYNQRFPLDAYVKNIQDSITKNGISLPQQPGQTQAGPKVRNWVRLNGQLVPQQ